MTPTLPLDPDWHEKYALKAEPAFSFHNACFKVRWANHHIRSLKHQMDHGGDIMPPLIKFDNNASSGDVTFITSNQMVWSYFSIAADTCANLRNSLDFCWMGLVRFFKPDGKRKETLPNADTDAIVCSQIEKQLAPVHHDAAKKLLIETIGTSKEQTTRSALLFQALNHLNNLQKHNQLPAILARTFFPVVNVHRRNQSLVQLPPFDLGPDAKRTFTVHGSIASIDFGGPFVTNLALGSVPHLSGVPLLAALEQLALETRRWVHAFHDAFPGNSFFPPERLFGPGLNLEPDPTYQYFA